MAAGYVLVLEDDDANTLSYWAGSGVTTNLDDVSFFDDIVAARQTAGTIQSQYTGHTVRVSPATKGITLGTTAQTPANVAESS